MKKIFYTVIYTLGIIGIFLSGANLIFAQSINVEFERTPLFSEANFLPQDSVNRFVKINNQTSSIVSASVKGINISNKGFGDFINFKIKSFGVTLFDGTLTEFLDKSSVNLPDMPIGQDIKIDFIATFLPTSNNSHQEESVSFNLQFIFEGVQIVNDINTNFGGSGSNGGVGNGPIFGSQNLIISNEMINSSNPPEFGSAIVTWNTNIPATSQVIYGLFSNGPYNLNLSSLNYGYPFASIESLSKTSNHSVLLSGLIPGEIYSMRVVSKASPPTVGYEYLFSIDQNGNVSAVENKNGRLIAQNFSNRSSIPNEISTGTVYLGSSPGLAGDEQYQAGYLEETYIENDSKDNNSQNLTANVIFGSNGFNLKTGLWLFGIVLLLFLFIFFWRRRKDEEENNLLV